MSTEIVTEAWEQLRELIEAEDSASVRALLNDLEPVETVRALLRLSNDERRQLVAMLSPEQAAELFEDLPDVHAVDLIERLDVDHAADIVDELPSDQGADLLGALDRQDAEAILEEMQPATADRVRDLISYSPDVAGGLMESERNAYLVTARVRDILADLKRRRDELGPLPQRMLLLDRHRRPVGAANVADILLAEPEARLADLSQPVQVVSALASLDELENYFDKYETLGVPVVDGEGRLVGRLRRRAVFAELAERAAEDQLKLQGIVGGEELRSMPIVVRSRRRLSWLSLNILLNIAAASVIAFFQDTVSAVIALAVFLPIVSDMSGCSGNQAVAVSMRELTLGVVQPRDVMRVWWQEVSVGLINGTVLGALISIVAILWRGSPMLGAVVGSALALNTVIAVSIGGTVPLLLKRFRADPAVASGPVLTTITDMCGFFLVLGLATLALPWLV